MSNITRTEQLHEREWIKVEVKNRKKITLEL